VLKPDLAAALGAERFLREIRITAQLNHPHILPLLDSGEAGEFLYYVMPYAAGESLRRRLNQRDPLSLDVVIPIVKPVAAALGHAHRHGVIHRDIKPENILFSEGLPIVSDFGIAKAVSSVGRDALTRSGFPLGTPGYMSPEQAAGNTDLDERTDVCGLACVVYEMLIGETPGVWSTPDEVKVGRFSELTAGHRERLERFPGRVEQVLVKALAIRPAQRIATPLEFVDALVAVAEPSAKVRDDKVHEILERAAELQDERETEDAALSIGGVEQVAAEVGIAPQRVREALDEVERPRASVLVPQRVTVPTRFTKDTLLLDRAVVGEVTESEHAALVDEIQSTLGIVGHVSTVGKSLTWSPAAPNHGHLAGWQNPHPYRRTLRVGGMEIVRPWLGCCSRGTAGSRGGSRTGAWGDRHRHPGPRRRVWWWFFDGERLHPHPGESAQTTAGRTGRSTCPAVRDGLFDRLTGCIVTPTR
jgi:hypothetical protein